MVPFTVDSFQINKASPAYPSSACFGTVDLLDGIVASYWLETSAAAPTIARYALASDRFLYPFAIGSTEVVVDPMKPITNLLPKVDFGQKELLQHFTTSNNQPASSEASSIIT